VACVNNAEVPGEVAVDFSFLDGEFSALIYTDGADVNSVISATETVSPSTVKTFSVGAGGGFVIKLTK
jgi:high-affinity K+ transport system ATPase subunit B